MRTIIIGDVHGCSRELQELLDKLNYRPGEGRLIFAGDMINKGPDSLGVLKLIQQYQAEAVMGNHEYGLLRYADGQLKSKGSFSSVLAQFGSEVDYWLKWLRQLPLYIETPEFIVVHGGMVPGMKLSEMPVQLITRIRTWDGKGDELNRSQDPTWYELYQAPKLVVYGHWAMQGLKVREHTIGLDSGCVWGGALSALELPSRQITQVKAHQQYAKPTGD